MYAYLEGNVAELSATYVLLHVNGVGYEVNISLHTYEQIKDKKTLRLFTHLQVREDAWVLYGFSQEQERTTFRQLLAISGVGAATARIILSSLSTEELSKIIATQDAKALEQVKGIGGKTAQRILLELKGKLAPASTPLESDNKILYNSTQDDALIALVNLGISKAVAQQALGKLQLAADTPVEEVIKQALRHL